MCAVPCHENPGCTRLFFFICIEISPLLLIFLLHSVLWSINFAPCLNLLFLVAVPYPGPTLFFFLNLLKVLASLNSSLSVLFLLPFPYHVLFSEFQSPLPLPRPFAFFLSTIKQISI